MLEVACDTPYETLCWAEKRLIAEQGRSVREFALEAKQYAERFAREQAAKRAESAPYETPATYI